MLSFTGTQKKKKYAEWLVHLDRNIFSSSSMQPAVIGPVELFGQPANVLIIIVCILHMLWFG